MRTSIPGKHLWPAVLLLVLVGCTHTCSPAFEGFLPPPEQYQFVFPEQQKLSLRDPAALKTASIPDLPAPRTVSSLQNDLPEWLLSLDEAIRIALQNTRVVRVLTGVSATSSGRTIYDPAITNATIDQAQARFDPEFVWRNTYDRMETPAVLQNAFNPSLGTIVGATSSAYHLALGLNKTSVLGGQGSVTLTENPTKLGGLGSTSGLNPQNRRALEMNYTQPLLQGGGFAVNTAPIALARIDTERSFFQLKDTVQELVRGVIEAYWQLVQARIDVWAREIQVEQFEEAYKIAQARKEVGLASAPDVAQAKVTYYQFRASLVAARANLLAREGALRNILGLPPEDKRRIVPTSPPASKRLSPDWKALVQLGEQQRPEVIDLKLALDSDNVRLLQARNLTLPRLDVTSLYRFNGLSGQLPGGAYISSHPGEFADWSMGLNFSVPLGTRDGRARARQAVLQVMRDLANLEQGLHRMVHALAIDIRELDNNYEQYLAFRETRTAALENVQAQFAAYRIGGGGLRNVIYLNVLQAVTDWGTAVTSEAQTLVNYNIGLANLERETGTILETHGLIFHEEGQLFPGPCGECGPCRDYPRATPPKGTPQRYPGTEKPAEEAFELEKPGTRPGEKGKKEKDGP